MKLKLSLADFEKQIGAFVSDAQSIMSNEPFKMSESESEFEIVKNKIQEWYDKCFQFLEDAFEHNETKYCIYAIEFHNAACENHVYFAGQQKDFKQLEKKKIEDFKQQIKYLEYLTGLVHISDAIVNPGIIKERSTFSTEQILSLLLDKLYYLYGNYTYYLISEILEGNGLTKTSYSENLEICNILGDKVEQFAGSGDVRIRLTLTGKLFIESKQKKMEKENKDIIVTVNNYGSNNPTNIAAGENINQSANQYFVDYEKLKQCGVDEKSIEELKLIEKEPDKNIKKSKVWNWVLQISATAVKNMPAIIECINSLMQ